MPESALPKWGLVATILAPAPEILRFVAHHLEAGAHRLYIYLDAENPEAFSALKAHPKVRVFTCDAAWWKKRGKVRPEKHQARQSMNATHAYDRSPEVDWLIHIDVDEFLVARRPIAEVLGDLPDSVETARVRPMEVLADGDGTAWKAFIPPGAAREAIIDRLYPTFGRYLRSGFMSHRNGKLFVRTGLPDVTLRIHNAFRHGEMIAGGTELADIDLAHRHAPDWESWRKSFDYRLEHGAYRAELDPARQGEAGQMSLHDLFRHLLEEEGEAGLRAFHDEVAADTQALRQRLDDAGFLRRTDLALSSVVRKHFPGAE